MCKRKILFIVEGERDEPSFLRKLFSTCYSKQQFETYTYRTNLHDLARRLEKDYPDFDTDEIDIKLILSSYEKNKKSKELLHEKYTDIFFIFDFEPQQDVQKFDTIRRMLVVLNDSTDQGKLFLNYPMMQSYKHFNSLPSPSFYNEVVTVQECKKYKQLVNTISSYKDINVYSYITFMSLSVHHLKKANYILSGKYDIPKLDDYLSWNNTVIFDKQLKSMEEHGKVYVLNTCIFILIDYRPESFFRQIKNRHGDFLI